MTSSSTVPAVKSQLVSLLTAALASESVPVFYAWNPEVTEESVFLGRPVFPGDDVSSRVLVTLTSPTAERTVASRAEYAIEGTCWSWRSDLQPDEAAEAEARAGELWELIREAVAPQSWVASMQAEHQLRPFEKGWAAMVVFTVNVVATLT